MPVYALAMKISPRRRGQDEGRARAHAGRGRALLCSPPADPAVKPMPLPRHGPPPPGLPSSRNTEARPPGSGPSPRPGPWDLAASSQPLRVPLRADGPRAGPAKALSAPLSRAVQRSRVQDSHLLVSRPWMDAGLLPPLNVSGPFGPDASSAAESSLGDAVLAPKLLPTRQDARRMVRAVGGAERAGRRRGVAGLAGSPPEPSPC